MTKGEARRLFLQYLGEATQNGQPKNDPDLAYAFDTLLDSAIVQVGASFPAAEYTAANGAWTAPQDFVEITRVRNSCGMPVCYTSRGEREFFFPEPCEVEYVRAPHMPDAAAGDDAAIDLDERVCALVPLQAALSAAMTMPDYRYTVPYITAELNSFSALLDRRNVPAARRVFAI